MGYANLKSERLGQIKKNKYGSLMQIVKYDNALDIEVKFLEHGNLVHTLYGNFCRGEVRNVYDKSVYNVGFIGEGKYKISIGNDKTRQYKVWKSMLQRCYDEKLHRKYPSYIDCTVSEEWHNYQNFAEWYDQNYYEVDKEQMCLDKDILIKGNKLYSPETCIFAPRSINILFTKSNVTRGEFPIGVSYVKRDKYFLAYCNDGKRNKYRIGRYDTPTEAFYAYKDYKENVIKQFADNFKDKIPNKLYNALIKYEVEIND